MTKTTKEIINLCLEDWDSLLTKYAFDNAESIWYSQSDFDQLRKELCNDISQYRDYHSSIFYVDIVDKHFDKFSQSKEVEK